MLVVFGNWAEVTIKFLLEFRTHAQYFLLYVEASISTGAWWTSMCLLVKAATLFTETFAVHKEPSVFPPKRKSRKKWRRRRSKSRALPLRIVSRPVTARRERSHDFLLHGKMKARVSGPIHVSTKIRRKKTKKMTPVFGKAIKHVPRARLSA